MKFAIRMLVVVAFSLKVGLTAFSHGISKCPHGSDVGTAAWQGLMSGMFNDSLEVAKHCIEKHKRSINEGGGPDNATALHLASAFDQYNTVRYLVRMGAHINIRDDAGWTPLHYAAVQGHASVCRYLVSVGADRNLRNHSGRTPEESAYARGSRGCAQVF